MLHLFIAIASVIFGITVTTLYLGYQIVELRAENSALLTLVDNHLHIGEHEIERKPSPPAKHRLELVHGGKGTVLQQRWSIDEDLLSTPGLLDIREKLAGMRGGR